MFYPSQCRDQCLLLTVPGCAAEIRLEQVNLQEVIDHLHQLLFALSVFLWDCWLIHWFYRHVNLSRVILCVDHPFKCISLWIGQLILEVDILWRDDTILICSHKLCSIRVNAETNASCWLFQAVQQRFGWSKWIYKKW